MMEGDLSLFSCAVQNSSQRLKIVYLPQQDALGMFRDHTIRAVLVHPLVPKDAKVIAVGYEYDRQAFAMIVEHPSFEEVIAGEQIPILTGVVGCQYEIWRKPEACSTLMSAFDVNCVVNWPKDLEGLQQLRNKIDELIYDLENR